MWHDRTAQCRAASVCGLSGAPAAAPGWVQWPLPPCGRALPPLHHPPDCHTCTSRTRLHIESTVRGVVTTDTVVVIKDGQPAIPGPMDMKIVVEK